MSRDADTRALDGKAVPPPSPEWSFRPHPRLDPVIAEISHWETSVPLSLSAFKLAENRDEYAEGEHAALIGPMPDRGVPTGLVVQGGAVVGKWGEPDRRDIAFSVSKGALSLLAGLALSEGIIPALDAPVSSTVAAPEFASEANSLITWRHLLSLTSEWEGSLWGIPDTIDFNRAVPKRPDSPPKGSFRERQPAGRYWEFNDVRVNVLALALTHAWGQSLEDILRERIMRPIGASGEWRWHGYENSVLEIGGKSVPVVSGGAHWGGGLVISAYDLARLALLHLRRGHWGERQLVPSVWFDALRSQCRLNPDFGLMWWTNLGESIPALSPLAIWSSGIANFLIVDPDLDLVVVMRWFDVPRGDRIIEKIVAGL